MISQDQIDRCIEVAKRYGVRKLVLFGSAANDPVHARDIDLICEGIKGVDFLMMGAEMENETGVMVDTVPADAPSAFIEYNMPKGRILYDSF
jgi:predicted nucleotidyltransferase